MIDESESPGSEISSGLDHARSATGNSTTWSDTALTRESLLSKAYQE